MLPTSGLPGHKGACFAGEISLSKDVIGEVRQVLAFEIRQIEPDALCRGMGVPAVYVLVVHPDGEWSVRCVK